MKIHAWPVLSLMLSLLALAPSLVPGGKRTGGDLLPVDSLWSGTVDQHRDDPDGLLPALLWIKTRKEDEFTGSMWYPRTASGIDALFDVGGRIDSKGNITLDSYRVVVGKGWTTGKTSGRISKGKITTQFKSDTAIADFSFKLVRDS